MICLHTLFTCELTLISISKMNDTKAVCSPGGLGKAVGPARARSGLMTGSDQQKQVLNGLHGPGEGYNGGMVINKNVF